MYSAPTCMLQIYDFVSVAYLRAAAVNGKCNSMHSFNAGNQSESTSVSNSSQAIRNRQPLPLAK